MQRVRWLIAAFMAVALLAVVAAGCGDDDGDSASQDGGGGGAPLKIGASLPLTGEFSEPGKAAEQGYKVWEAMVNDEGRPARPRRRAGHQGRRVQPEHDRRRLQRADQPGQGRPAARHLLLAAQPAGLRGRRAQPDALRRARRRRARHVQPRLQVPLLRPAGDGRQAGRRVRQLHRRPARGRAADDGRLPDARRPVRPADLRGHREDPRRRPASRPSTARPTRSTTRTSTRSPTRSSRATPTSSSTARTFEDGVGLVRAMLKVDFTPEWLFQTNAPSFGEPVLEGHRRGEHRGRLLRGQPLAGGRHARQRRVRRQVRGDVRRRPGARGRGRRASRPAQVMQAAVEARRLDRRPARARRLAARERGRDDPRPAELGRRRQPDRRVPDRPVAERHAGDRAARGGRDGGRDRAGLAARFQVSHRPAE